MTAAKIIATPTALLRPSPNDGAATSAVPASPTASQDVVVAKYTDNGATAAFSWSQVAGGTGQVLLGHHGVEYTQQVQIECQETHLLAKKLYSRII